MPGTKRNQGSSEFEDLPLQELPENLRSEAKRLLRCFLRFGLYYERRLQDKDSARYGS